MLLSREQVSHLEQRINQSLAKQSLTDWERNFLISMRNKFQRFDARTQLSPKQYSTLISLTAIEQPRNPWRPSATVYSLPNARRARKSSIWLSRGIKGRLAAPVLLLLFFAGLAINDRLLGPADNVVQSTSRNQVVGPVTRVRDGDTIEVAGIPIRFRGLDCAESGTPDGDLATARMRELVRAQRLQCTLNGETSYDRKIGDCRIAGGLDLTYVMISERYCSMY